MCLVEQVVRVHLGVEMRWLQQVGPVWMLLEHQMAVDVCQPVGHLKGQA